MSISDNDDDEEYDDDERSKCGSGLSVFVVIESHDVCLRVRSYVTK